MGNITPFKKRTFLPFMTILIFLLIVLINGPSVLPLPQQKPPEKKIYHRVAVSAISLAVTVQSRKGKFINDLTKEDFAIYENNKKQDITYFNQNFGANVSLTVLLDVSGSMAIQEKLTESKEMLDYLITRLLKPQDEVSLLIFADGEVEIAVNFTENKDDFVTVLEGIEAYGQTALNDAVGVSPEFANRGKYEKRALLLITDGIENDSQYSQDQALEVAKRVDIPIYTVGYKIPLSEQYLKKYKRSPTLTSTGIVISLKKFSEATGGKAFFINHAEELKETFLEIKRVLSHQYIIGYTSYSSEKNEFRRIKVVTSKKRYKVRAREGYYSSEQVDK